MLAGFNLNIYPNAATNFWPAQPVEPIFVDAAANNYALPAGSPYKNAGTDQVDVGADIATVTSEAQIAISGNAPAAPLVITTTSVSSGTVNTPYSFTVQAQGGTPPYTWSIPAGALPAGLTLSAGGDLTGTPSAAGTYSYTLRVTDAASATATQPITQTISPPAAALTITTTSVPYGIVGCAYSFAFQAQGGTAPYSWSVSAGALPPGLTLSSAGSLTGTPTAIGSFTYTVRVTDAASGSDTQDIVHTITSAPTAAEQVYHASDVGTYFGAFQKVNGDTTAADGIKFTTADNGAAATTAPLANPTTDYIERFFDAQPNTKYRLWLRLKATGDSKWNDSVWVQFNDSVDSVGNPIYRIGTTNGLLVNLKDCNACGVSGWGWQNHAYWLTDTGEVWFASGARHTIRIQIREDGVQLDQIVISPMQYLTSPPGPVKNDNTIVPHPSGNAPPTVQLTAPGGGATFAEPATITLTANASDSDGSVSKVDFFAGATLVGTDFSAPFSFTWTNVPAGNYSLTAVATDNVGATTTSAAVNITVTAAQPDEVIHASDIGQYFGAFVKVNYDTTAADGIKFTTADNGVPATTAPVANPTTDYIEAFFSAQPNTKYRVWLRLKTIGDSKWNDSAWVQFNDSVDGAGNPIYRIGSTNGLLVNLEDCNACGVSGWGWQNRAYWLPDTGEVWFADSARHTIRIQIREDGVELDQIVISPSRYLTSPPGPVKNDNTIVPHS